MGAPFLSLIESLNLENNSVGIKYMYNNVTHVYTMDYGNLGARIPLSGLLGIPFLAPSTLLLGVTVYS